MKVAIVTQFGDNYGNKLQNYALQQLLLSLGHDASTIIIKDGNKLNYPEDALSVIKKFSPFYMKAVLSSRFKNKYPYKNSRDGVWKSIRFAKNGLVNELNEQRKKAFANFSKLHLKIDTLPYIPGDYRYPDNYDAYICGSDQIWNPNYSSTSSAYFLQFAPQQKRVAFAPSFGISELPEVIKPLYREWLNGIPILSVREEKGAEIIKSLTGREVPVLPDPTMCLSAAEWESIEKRPDFARGKYVLTYFLGNETNKYRRYIEKYAKKNHLRIINLFDMREPDFYLADPAEFVWLIHHADTIFTDSFHGTVFSLIFHVPFVVFERVESGGSGMSSRIDTLLKLTGMEERRFGWTPLDRIHSISFSESDISIALRVEKARKFLKQALNAIDSTDKANRGRSCDNQENQEYTEAIRKHSEYVRSFKQDCSGCTACINICPVQCISMEVDQEGFSYPQIDSSRCIHCGNCRRVCKESEQECANRNGVAYVAYAIDDNLRKYSSSGGVFSVIAEKIIEKGGFVYGARFNKDFKVAHYSIDSKDKLFALRGSKYVQSNIGNCFTEIKEKLEHGILVYFSGTPCQVDGLLAFLGREYDNLYTQDIICHGVPSPSVWKAYLQLRSGGERIKSVSFRDKTYGWHYFSMKIETEKRKYVKRLDEDTYMRLFLNNVILRPSCYACHHKHIHRKADFTLADCWGEQRELNDDDKGLSMFFVNSEKGQRLFEAVDNDLYFQSISFDEAVNKQTALTKSVPYNQNRELFFTLASNEGMIKTIKKWYECDVENCLKRRVEYTRYRISRLVR